MGVWVDDLNASVNDMTTLDSLLPLQAFSGVWICVPKYRSFQMYNY